VRGKREGSATRFLPGKEEKKKKKKKIILRRVRGRETRSPVDFGKKKKKRREGFFFPFLTAAKSGGGERMQHIPLSDFKRKGGKECAHFWRNLSTPSPAHDRREGEEGRWLVQEKKKGGSPPYFYYLRAEKKKKEANDLQHSEGSERKLSPISSSTLQRAE